MYERRLLSPVPSLPWSRFFFSGVTDRTVTMYECRLLSPVPSLLWSRFFFSGVTGGPASSGVGVDECVGCFASSHCLWSIGMALLSARSRVPGAILSLACRGKHTSSAVQRRRALTSPTRLRSSYRRHT